MKIYLTNVPSFYKIRLLNEVNKREKILAIFMDAEEETRNSDFFDEPICFDYLLLSGSKSAKIRQLVKTIINTDYRELIVEGWDALLSWVALFVSPMKKNSCSVESSIYESKTTGLKSLLKVLFLKRVSKVYACGVAQTALARALKYHGEIKTSGGCGILNYIPQPTYVAKEKVQDFIYVGRLVTVKNLEFLIQVFNTLPDLCLHIVGFGELEGRLKCIAKENIIFHGAVKNKELSAYYQKSDVFVLPSIIEPWGLVVEEALNNGLPVLVSDRVGCKDDLATPETGLVFNYNDTDDLRKNILKMTDVDFYNSLRKNVALMDFQKRTEHQIVTFAK